MATAYGQIELVKPGQAKQLFEALRCPKDYMLFTEEEAAEEHCQMGAILISSARMLDWLEDIMAKGTEQRRGIAVSDGKGGMIMTRVYTTAVCVLLLVMGGCASVRKNKARCTGPSTRGEMMRQVIAMQAELLSPSPSADLRERYRELCEDMPFAVILTNAEGNVLEANSRYQDLTGYTLEELRELTYQQLTPEKWHQAEAGIVAVAETVPYVAFEKEYLNKDGEAVPISLTGWVIKDANGEVLGTGSFVSDISDRIRKEGF